jgi:Subtilase family
MKPDISAPGVTVRSSLRTNDTAYGNMSGTSMASPHVVGSVALLWSARPSLVRDVPRTKWLLTRSANPAVTVPNNAAGCGGIGSVPNNHFGWGRLDVLAAYDLEPSLHQTITFPAIDDRLIADPDFDLNATASSGLSVAYSASGSCSVNGTTVHIERIGFCTITASEEGLDAYDISPGAPKPWFAAADVSRTFNVAYPFSGFFQPIDNDKPNGAQAGSAVPVKFSLGGDRTMDIFAAGYPKSSPVSCETSVPSDPLEEIDTPGRAGSSTPWAPTSTTTCGRRTRAGRGRAASSR